MSFESPAEVLSCVARYGLSEHPLVRGLSRLSKRRAALWLLVSNAFELQQHYRGVRGAPQDLAARQPTAGTLAARRLSRLRHLFAEALQGYEFSPDRLEATAARCAATSAAKALAKTLAEFLETEETSSVGFSLDAILREGPEVEAMRLSELDAAGPHGLPSTVRGAFGMHQRLWSALDRLEALSLAEQELA